MGYKWISKKWEIINDTMLTIVGIVLLVTLKLFYSTHFAAVVFLAVTGLFLATIGIIGLFVDIRIVEKHRERAIWWQLNLPVVLGFLLINSGSFYAASNSSDTYRIISISVGIALWILAFSYDIWRKYRRYLKNKQNLGPN